MMDIDSENYAMQLWDGDTDSTLYFRYMTNTQGLCMLASEDRLTFWLLVYASEGKELP